MKKQKKKYVSFLGSFDNLRGMTDVLRQLIENLSKNFEKIYIINSKNLELFNKNRNNEEKNYKINIPNNCILFNPKNYKEFNEFLIDKDILVIRSFGKTFKTLKIHFFLRYKNIKVIQVSNFGFVNTQPAILDFKKNTILSLKYFFDYIVFRKIVVLLGGLGLFAKNEICFLSNKPILESIEKNPIKNFFYKNKLFYTKKIILVNSRNHDTLLKNKYALSEEYIVHLEGGINRGDELRFREKLDEKTVNNHYYFLNKSLKKLSKEFKKEVIVCIHPRDNLSEYQSYFGQFKVVQFKTSEYIYKSYLATVFDSSAVTDAILLKKRIIGLISEYMCASSQKRSELCARRFGFMTINMKKIVSLDKNKILSEIERKIPGYESYIKNFHTINNPKVLGNDQIIETIKKNFSTIVI
jgi:hypothetical protein